MWGGELFRVEKGAFFWFPWRRWVRGVWVVLGGVLRWAHGVVLELSSKGGM